MLRNSEMASRRVRFSLVALLIVGPAVYVLRGPIDELRVKASYLLWKVLGVGVYHAEYDGHLGGDSDRDKIVKGLGVDQIRRKFGELTDGDSYREPNSYRSGELTDGDVYREPDSYRRGALGCRRSSYRQHDANGEYKLYWLDAPDGFGWAIEVIDGKARRMFLIKG
jgi:hypothetical protein